jgi:hypothetical protein
MSPAIEPPSISRRIVWEGPPPATNLRHFLLWVDSICSHVAARGLDDEARTELRAVGLACRERLAAMENPDAH